LDALAGAEAAGLVSGQTQLERAPMSAMLVIYATTEGQTRKIAEFAAARLRQRGHTVDLADAAETRDAYEVSRFSAVLVAASLHMGKYQAQARRFAHTHAAALAKLQTMFLSVSLSAAETNPADREGLDDCVAQFIAETGWRPGRIEHVAGSFRYTEYDFFKRWMMKRIAKEHDAPVDTSRDWELTDWDALGAAVDRFAAEIQTD
jgi:menaquinone-dependent protoporphyrinogen oxidase